MIPHPVCLMKGIFRSIRHRAFVSGCDSVTVDDTPSNVHVIQCTRCGKHSVSWSKGSLEAQK